MLRAVRLVASMRALSCSAVSFSAPATASAPALMKLRRRTGYSYVNCRKALVQFGPDKLKEAEAWLRQNAEKEGWAKAAKLSNRATTQGLVGVRAHGEHAAVVELTCETDFVARSEAFKGLLEQLTLAVLKSGEAEKADGKTIRSVLQDLTSVKIADGKSLKEAVALTVGKLGENITLKRVEHFVAPSGFQLFHSSHPKEGGSSPVAMGRFASLIALRRSVNASEFPSKRLGDQLCQHIIGMRSTNVGIPPAERKEKNQTADNSSAGEPDELNDFFKGETTHVDEEETQLLRQAFMFNPSQSVYEYLQSHGAEVADFVRVELGGEKGDDD